MPRWPHPSTQCQFPSAATRSTTCTAWRPTPRFLNADSNAPANRRCSSQHIGQSAPSSSTITATTRSAPEDSAISARRSTFAASSADRSARMTAPRRPASMDTSTRDFSGTKPRTAGKAAISAPGLVKLKPGGVVCSDVMPPTLSTAAVICGCRRAPPRSTCGLMRNWGDNEHDGNHRRSCGVLRAVPVILAPFDGAVEDRRRDSGGRIRP